jgi:gamma-glutamyltranspeptidase / glutathione hydrolase
MHAFCRGIVFTLVVTASVCAAQDRSYGRSVVASQYGIVATSEVQASEAGARMLERGGSAIDAGIAANAVLNVMEPMMNGMGGDLFAIYWEAKTGKLYGLNASGWAPKALTPEYLKAKSVTGMPQTGIDSITVPGVVDGWAKLHGRFGKLPWRELFQPAIGYAKQGFPVTEIMDDDWQELAEALKKNAETQRVFLPGDKAPERWQMFRDPDVAHALTLVADEGEAAFYKGEIAKAILKTSRGLGGTMKADDLAKYSAEWVEPISVKYRDWTVYELPPNGDGIAALEMLNIMEQSKPDAGGPYNASELHTRIEAMKLAYSDVKAYDGDPRFAKIPVDELLSKEFAGRRAKLIDSVRANCDVAPAALGKSDTTYFTVVDREGNILSIIQSNYSAFGSKITVEGMGFVLQNRGALFTLDPKSPDVLAGRKRPFHTIIPAFMQRGDQHIGFGIMGGMNQPLAHAQFVSNIADYGMNIQQALEEARFTVSATLGCNILIESRVGKATIDALTGMGHVLDVRDAYSAHMGRGNVVMHDSAKGVNFGASDPRGDGAAVVEMHGSLEHGDEGTRKPGRVKAEH